MDLEGLPDFLREVFSAGEKKRVRVRRVGALDDYERQLNENLLAQLEGIKAVIADTKARMTKLDSTRQLFWATIKQRLELYDTDMQFDEKTLEIFETKIEDRAEAEAEPDLPSPEEGA
jgi:hypothetical protein